MDDTAKQGVQQPILATPVSPQGNQQVQPIGGRKEAPIGMPQSGEWVSPSTPEIVLPQEVKAAGVEAHPPIPQVSQAATQSGVRMANEAMTITPVTAETINIHTSRSVLNQLKAVHKSVKDSFSWLVRLLIKEQDKKEKGASL